MASKCVEGKVIVVTGAGRGIGREIAMLAAAEEVRLLSTTSAARPTAMAATSAWLQAVANEISKAGGVAVANGDSVAPSRRSRAHCQSGDRSLRPHRLCGEQRRHPA